MADAQLYASYEEMIYSIVGHGDAAGGYDGTVYIKEAVSSRLLETWQGVDPFRRAARHFSLVGGDHCYEVLTLSPPLIEEFASVEAALAWAPISSPPR